LPVAIRVRLEDNLWTITLTGRRKFLCRLLDFVASAARLCWVLLETARSRHNLSRPAPPTTPAHAVLPPAHPLFARSVEVFPDAHLLARARSGALDAARAETFPMPKTFFCRNFSAANRISDFLRGERTMVLRCALAHRHAIAVGDGGQGQRQPTARTGAAR
jgi:hypothetical protein